MESNRLNIARNVKKLRKSKKVSQDRLSKLADLSLNTVVMVESGANENPTIQTLMKIAKGLDVGINDLIKD